MDNKKEPPPVENNAEFSPYIILIIVFLVTCVFLFFYQRKRTSRRAILLTGLSNSGKTVIFSHLVYGTYVNTQTSMKENLGDFTVNNASLKIIDIPGYERLRGKYFDQYKASALAIAYVIDSVTLQKDIRDVAECLYNILLDASFTSGISDVLIVCNKQDLDLSKGMSVIKNLLEKELNALRITKSSQLEAVDSKATKKLFLGKEGKEFTFDSLRSVRVEFIEANASGDSPDLKQLEKWLSSVAV